MFRHSELGADFQAKRQLKKLITDGQIAIGGNSQLKIYGTLSCKSGRRMKIQNRVFFKSEEEATENAFRPCGHCMREKYLKWKKLFDR